MSFCVHNMCVCKLLCQWFVEVRNIALFRSVIFAACLLTVASKVKSVAV